MTEQEKFIQPDPVEEDEIDLLKLAKTLWSGRKTLYITLSVGFILGVFVAVFSPKSYTATTIMVPQMSNSSTSKLGGLGGLAALAGIDISAQTGSEMSPLVYPKIVESIPFKLELINTPITFSDVDHPVSLLDYSSNYSKKNILGVLKKYTLGLPGVIIGAIKGKTKELEVSDELKSKLIYLTDDQYQLIRNMDDVVSLDADAKQGILTLTVSLPEALAAAQLAQKAQDILQRDIIDFKVQKAKADLDFIQGRYDVAKAEAEGYQMNLARKTDQYKNLTSAVPQVQSDRLQSRYGIANSVFQDLAKQLEQAKIQVKKDTPVFTIVQPVTIPSEKSKPNKPMILFIWVFLGGIVGIGIIFGKGFMADVKKKWQEEE